MTKFQKPGGAAPGSEMDENVSRFNKRENDYRQERHTAPRTFCGKLHVVTRIRAQRGELKSKRISERPEMLSMF